jgi:hypothetical protein
MKKNEIKIFLYKFILISLNWTRFDDDDERNPSERNEQTQSSG